jgi:hypothetical protein
MIYHDMTFGCRTDDASAGGGALLALTLFHVEFTVM